MSAVFHTIALVVIAIQIATISIAITTNAIVISIVITISLLVNDSNVNCIVDLLMEMFEVAVNVILYVRNVYPRGIFERYQKYNMVVMVKAIDISSPKF